MKNAALAALILLPLASLPAAATPPDFYCGIETSELIVTVEYLCTKPKQAIPQRRLSQTQQSPQPSRSGKSTAPTDAELQQLGQFKWATAYCQAREDGKAKTTAEQAGLEAVNEWLLDDAIRLFGLKSIIQFISGPLDEVLISGPTKAAMLCPEL